MLSWGVNLGTHVWGCTLGFLLGCAGCEMSLGWVLGVNGVCGAWGICGVYIGGQWGVWGCPWGEGWVPAPSCSLSSPSSVLQRCGWIQYVGGPLVTHVSPW